jgi:LysM repeat protein
MSTQNCETVTYIVQTTDTLESVARRFGIQKSVIMEYNNMSTEKLSPKMELFIPFCESTPTGLRTTASHTVTVTPLNGATITFQPE